jgi:ABC-type molybdate transport system ATPase subunit
LLADSGGDLIERSGGLQWLITYAHTYATVILEVLEEGRVASDTMAAIIRRLSEERKAALYQEAEGLLNDIISKSEEHFELTAMRWDML